MSCDIWKCKICHGMVCISLSECPCQAGLPESVSVEDALALVINLLKDKNKECDRLKAENALLEECRAYYGDTNNWAKQNQTSFILANKDDRTKESYSQMYHATFGGKLARETKILIDKLRNKDIQE